MTVGDTLVLCYHGVSETWPAGELAVTPTDLRRQLELLLARGYRGVTFSEAVQEGRGRTVAVTFDDAFRSVADIARPILDELGIPATIFVPTDYAGRAEPMTWPEIEHWTGTAHEHELMPLTWDQLGSLAESGWEIGSHGKSHPHLTRLSDGELHAELGDSRRTCEERLQRECRSLAYPYGDHDARVVEAARAAGYRAACTLPSRIGAQLPMRWPRIGIYRGDGERSFRLKVSPSIRRLRRTPLWNPLTMPARRWRGRDRAAS